MATKKKATNNPKPVEITSKRVKVIGTGKHPNHAQVERRVRVINAKRAEKLVKLGWFTYAE